MPQPTIDGLQLDAGSGGDQLVGDTINGKFAQGVLMGYSGGDGVFNFVAADLGLPVILLAGSAAIGKLAANAGVVIGAVEQSGAWTVDLGAVDNAVIDAIAASVAAASTEATLSTLNGKVTACNTGAVVVSSSALPTGAATAANQSSGNASLSSIDGKVTACDTGAVTVAASALPTGAATAANQATIISGLASVDGHVDGVEALLGSIDGNIVACNTGAVVVSSSALPSGASTEATLSTLNGKVTACNTGAVVLAEGTAAFGKLAANSGVDIGDIDVLSIAAGSNLIGDVGLQPRTTGGLTMHKTTSAASTNATSVKASAGQIYSIQCFNVNAAVRYLKIYNKASAPTVGTDTPVKTLAIPGNAAGAGFVISWPQGLALGTGIAFALTTEATDAGTTGVAANEITVNIDYK